MPLQVGSPTPTFEAEAFLCASEEFKTISLSDYEGKWLCLYFYAMDFTGVCPTEVAAFDQAIDRLLCGGAFIDFVGTCDGCSSLDCDTLIAENRLQSSQQQRYISLGRRTTHQPDTPGFTGKRSESASNFNTVLVK